MKRQTRLLLSLMSKLAEALAEKTELFLQERPFLLPKEEILAIENLSESKQENEAKINILIEKIQEEIDK